MTTAIESQLEGFLRVQTDIANRQYAEMVNETAKTVIYKDNDLDRFLCDNESLRIAKGSIPPTQEQPDVTNITDPIDPLLFRYEDTILAIQGKTKRTTQWSKTPIQQTKSNPAIDFFLCVMVLTILILGSILGVALLFLL